jgi:hypothetical protein
MLLEGIQMVDNFPYKMTISFHIGKWKMFTHFNFSIIEEISPHQVHPQRVQKETLLSHQHQSLVTEQTMLECRGPILQKG